MSKKKIDLSLGLPEEGKRWVKWRNECGNWEKGCRIVDDEGNVTFEQCGDEVDAPEEYFFLADDGAGESISDPITGKVICGLAEASTAELAPGDMALTCDADGNLVAKPVPVDSDTTYNWALTNPPNDGDGIIGYTITGSDGSVRVVTIDTGVHTVDTDTDTIVGQPAPATAGGILTFPVTDMDGNPLSDLVVDLSAMLSTPHPDVLDGSSSDSVAVVLNAGGSYTVNGSQTTQVVDPATGVITTTFTSPDGTETVIKSGPDDECAEFASAATNPCNVSLLGCENGNKVSVPLDDIKSKRVVCGLEAAVTREGMLFTSSSAVNLAAGNYFTMHFEGTVTGAAGVVTGVTTAGNAQIHPSALGGSFAVLRTANGAEHNLTWRVTRVPTLNVLGCPSDVERFIGGVSDLDTDAASMEGSCIAVLNGDWEFEAFPVDSGYSETSPGVFCTDSTLPDGQPSLTGEADILPFVGQSASAIVTQAGADWVSPHFFCDYYRPVQVTLDCDGTFESAIDWLGNPIAESLITYTA